MNGFESRPVKLPRVTVTMLGVEGSGKSCFMVGMYGAMSTGIDGYAIYADSFKDRVALLGHWQRLLDDGEYPPPNDAHGYKVYEFVVNHGMQDAIMQIDWLDYRGGALADQSEPEDSQMLQDRLVASDSVYVILDGMRIGEWMAERLGGHDRGTAKVQSQLGVTSITNLLLHAVRKRQAGQLRAPSLVVLVTKEDRLLEAVPGLSRDAVLDSLEAILQEILPLAFFDGVTTLINTTTLQSVGRGDGSDRAFKTPFLFTFVEFLRNKIADEERFLLAAVEDGVKTKEQIALLSERVGNVRKLLHNGRLRRLDDEYRRVVEACRNRTASLKEMRRQTSSLEAELSHIAVYESGHRRTNG